MEIHQLRYFVVVAEEGSFSNAAEREHVSQPSLSPQNPRARARKATGSATNLESRLPRGQNLECLKHSSKSVKVICGGSAANSLPVT